MAYNNQKGDTSMKFKVFVDGQEGTTGLKINERLEARRDIDILKIAPDKRKDPDERGRFLNEADIAFLCLPDAAAKEAVSLVHNSHTRIIDASTAHRTSEDWAYGLPELSRSQRETIKSANRVANPGCFATGFNLLMHPLVKEGIITADYPASCHAISGYSGGGKKLIERYESADGMEAGLQSPCMYALGLSHKHIPEMQLISGLKHKPLFSPSVSCFYQGMNVTVPLHSRLLPGNPSANMIYDFLEAYYKDEYFISVMPFGSENTLKNGCLDAMACNHTNKVELFVFGNSEQTMLTARFDNLGKGASGAAIQNMNIMLGLDEKNGLE